MTPHDREEAVKIGIGLSTQFIGATLGLLTVIGGVVTFLLGQKQSAPWAIVFLVFGVLALLASSFYGFQGIAKARNSGSRGWWAINVSAKEFDVQTGLGLAGIIFFGISITILLMTPSEEDKKFEAIRSNQELLSQVVSHLTVKDSLSQCCCNSGTVKLVLDSLGAVGGFTVGVADQGYNVNQLGLIKNALRQDDNVSLIFLVGEVDKRELVGKSRLIFDSNVTLARARAEFIRSEISEVCKQRDISIFVTSRGAFHTGEQVDDRSKTADRQVVIYCLRTTQRTP